MTTTADRRDAAPPYTTRDYTSKYKVVGTRPIRHDGLDKVTGRAKYGADTLLPGLLHAKVLRSPHAHARILSIDASKALAMPGVRAVMTADDLPIVHKRDLGFARLLGDPRMSAESVIASKKALYQADTPSPPSPPSAPTRPRRRSTRSRSSTKSCPRSSTCAPRWAATPPSSTRH